MHCGAADGARRSDATGELEPRRSGRRPWAGECARLWFGDGGDELGSEGLGGHVDVEAAVELAPVVVLVITDGFEFEDGVVGLT